jgi:hypothetical protein
VEICATGGFKAEMAYLNLVGILCECPVHYIHEQFDELVTLPPLPVTWDTSFVEQNLEFFSWIDDEPRKADQVENRLKAAPALRQLVSFEDDGCGYLTAAGTALYEAYKERTGAASVRWPEKCQVPPDKKLQWSGTEHHRPRDADRLGEELAKNPYVCAIWFEGEGQGRTGVEVTDAAAGTLRVLRKTDRTIKLKVKTTARGEEQCELVAGEIKRTLKELQGR